MEQFAKKLAHTIALSQGSGKEQEAVIAYGLIALLQMSAIACFITFFGILFDLTYESILIFLGVGLLRKATGGAHSNSIYRCMVTSCFHILLVAFLSKSLLGVVTNSVSYLMLMVLCFVWCTIIVYVKAPVDSPRKPITSETKRTRLRKQSFLTVGLYFLLCVLFWGLSRYHLRFLSLASSICLLTMWQCFTLTRLGHRFIAIIDGL